MPIDPTYAERTHLLLGDTGLARLRSAHVFVAGIGGVGSYAAEALARAGVGRLTLLDHDSVAASNCNRQLVALRSTVGQLKADVMAARIADIDPDIELSLHREFLDSDRMASIVPGDTDWVLDCIDSIASKAALVEYCQHNGIGVFSSMGAGGRIDPTAVRVGMLAETRCCPLAREMRKHLRKRNASLDYPVVYSIETPKKGTEHRPVGSADAPGRPRSVNGTISYLPALFGLTLAGEAIRRIVGTR